MSMPYFQSSSLIITPFEGQHSLLGDLYYIPSQEADCPLSLT